MSRRREPAHEALGRESEPTARPASIRTKGAARRGYAIDKTTRYTDARSTFVEIVKLVELSDQPLDPSLFDIPADFRPALPIPGGGVDLTKPDSVANRLQAYWDAVRSMVSRGLSWWGR